MHASRAGSNPVSSTQGDCYEHKTIFDCRSNPIDTAWTICYTTQIGGTMPHYTEYLKGKGTLSNKELDRLVDKVERIVVQLQQQDKLEKMQQVEKQPQARLAQR